MFEKGFAREQLERVARMYHSVNDASRAMGITPRSFSRCVGSTTSTPLGSANGVAAKRLGAPTASQAFCKSPGG